MAIVLENAQGPADPVAAAAAALVEAAAADEREFTSGALHALLAGALAPLAEGGDESAMTPADHVARAQEHLGESKRHGDVHAEHASKSIQTMRSDPGKSEEHRAVAQDAHAKMVHHNSRASHHILQATRKI